MIVDGGYNLPAGTLVKPAAEKEEAKDTEEAKDEKPAQPAAEKPEASAEPAK